MLILAAVGQNTGLKSVRHLLFVALFVAAAPSAAAIPLRYQFDLTPQFSTSHPLYAAHIGIEMIWDPTDLAPTVGTDPTDPTRPTLLWSSSTTVGHLAVSGTASLDGTYPATFKGTWRFFEFTELSFTKFATPFVEAKVGDDFIGVHDISFDFRGGDAAGPRPFGATEPFRRFPPHIFHGRARTDRGGVSGYAVAIPEPATAIMGSVALLSLATLRCRK